MSTDYHQRFMALLGDITIDDLLKRTVGYHESIEGSNQVNEWVKENVKPDADLKEFDEIFSSCLHAQETLWFNLAWFRGWMVGVVNILKLQMDNNSDSIQGVMEENFLSLWNFKP